MYFRRGEILKAPYLGNHPAFVISKASPKARGLDKEAPPGTKRYTRTWSLYEKKIKSLVCACRTITCVDTQRYLDALFRVTRC